MSIPSGWTRKGNRITSPNGSYITRHELEQGVWYNCWRPKGGCMDAGYGPEALARCIEACTRLDTTAATAANGD
jgi:hypothetical protein